MSNLEIRPAETTAGPQQDVAEVEILSPRLVPLGGPRAMTVRRTLPQRQRSLIGGWCFIDHYGPDQVAQTGGMSVPPHPHSELQTASWLFTGEVEHRDSAGNHALIRPGELNLMTAGRGISHSEVSAPGTTVLHGAQLWVALPSGARFTEPGFERYVPDPVHGDGFTARVFLGSLLGRSSPVATHSALVGAEITLAPGATAELALDAAFEHGVLADTGPVTVNGTPVEAASLAYLAPGHPVLRLHTPEGGRVLLLGGAPLGEQIVMWWNFIGRSHDDIVRYRAAWQAEIAAGHTGPGPFGLPADDQLPPLPAPPLPSVTLRPRG